MSVTLTFPPEIEKRLQERATQNGQTVELFLRQLVEREVLGVNGGQPASASPTFETICAPIAETVAASEMTDDEVRDFFTEVRAEVRAEKRVKQAQGQPNG
jgi:hypothetical protein